PPLSQNGVAASPRVSILPPSSPRFIEGETPIEPSTLAPPMGVHPSFARNSSMVGILPSFSSSSSSASPFGKLIGREDATLHAHPPCYSPRREEEAPLETHTTHPHTQSSLPSAAGKSPSVKMSRRVYIETKGENRIYRFFRGILNLFLPKKVKITPKLQTAVYVGEIDQAGHPHGFGHWKADTFHGETLVGYWDHGIPVAPFKSREVGTGSGFMSIRIGWAKVTTHSSDMEFGIADVECCVSGAFFRRFPRVTIYPINREISETETKSINKFPVKKRLAYLLMRVGIASSSEFSLKSPVESVEIRNTSHIMDEDVNIPPQNQMYGRNTWLSQSTYSMGKAGDLENASRTSTRGAIFKFSKKSRIKFHNATHAARKLFLGRKKFQTEDEINTRRRFDRYMMSSVLANMCPHLPDFGFMRSTELHITVDSERGLYVAGWVPLEASSSSTAMNKSEDPQMQDISINHPTVQNNSLFSSRDEFSPSLLSNVPSSGWSGDGSPPTLSHPY
ncbi:hypothetical protein IE077_003327, partial [Cardiosporidium cionae]